MENSESRTAPSPEAASDDFASPIELSPAEARAYWRGVRDGLRRAGADVPPDVAANTAADEPAEAPPWENDPPEDAGRQRHDAFTGAKKQAYLKTLAKAGCILDACRLTGVSSSTVYNHQSSDPEFERNCRLALAMASTPLELTAYERAVVGVEEDVIRGGKVVGTRIRRSDYMLRMMLQGSNPKKYGPRPGFTRKRMLKFERNQIEREVRAELEEPNVTFEDAIGELDRKLDHFRARTAGQRRDQGWTDLGCGVWVPPGWVWAGEGDPRDAITEAGENGDAVCNSSKSSTSPPSASPSPDGEGGETARPAGGRPEGGTGCEDSRQAQHGGGVEGAESAGPALEPPTPVHLPLHHATRGPPPHAPHGEASLPPAPRIA